MLARPSVNIQPRWLGPESWPGTKAYSDGRDRIGIKAGHKQARSRDAIAVNSLGVPGLASAG